MAVKKTGLGRGLEALLGSSPARPEPEFVPPPSDDLANIPLDLLQRGSLSSRAWTCARRACRNSPTPFGRKAYVQPIVVTDRLAPWRRWLAALRNHRWRAPLACRPDGESRDDSRHHPARTGRCGRCDVPHRKHPAGESQSARGSPRTGATDRGIQHDAPRRRPMQWAAHASL